MPTPAASEAYRFGRFTLDATAFDLRRDGRTVRLERQPMDLLLVLVRRRGQLVTRAEIADLLWGQDVFVEVETGIHTAVRKIRIALGDAADAPTFVETVPGKGYRFVAEVDASSMPVAAPIAVAEPEPSLPLGGTTPRAGRRAWWLVAAGVVLLGLGAAGSRLFPRPVAPSLIAVLPFANLSGNPDMEHVADGLAEETIASLGQIDPDHLGVVGRTSMLRYRGTALSLADIGRELGATYLVESSLRSEGTRLRVTSRLVRAADQVQVWSQSFDREPASLLGVQQELSAAIVEQIRSRLSPARASALARRQTRDPQAYDLYLRGLSFANRRNPDANRQAVDYYAQATALDPGYALAWAGMASVQASSVFNGDAQPATAGPRVRDAADRALAADPQLAEAQLAYAYMNWSITWNWPEAEQAARRAMALDPQYVDAPRLLGHILSQMGRHTDAATIMARARALEPLDAMSHALSSQIAFQARHHDEALQHAARAIALAPALWIGHMMRAQAAAALGQVDAALEALDDAERLSGRNSKAVSLRAYLLGATGRAADARQVVAALEDAARQRYIPPVAIALGYAGLGDTARVFTWLDRAYEARDVHLLYLTVDPKWDAYRDQPRFQALLARCGFVTGPPPSRAR